MVAWSQIVAKLISVILSWLQAGNLRNQMYEMKDRIEILETALEDVGRMSHDPKIIKIVETTLKRHNHE